MLIFRLNTIFKRCWLMISRNNLIATSKYLLVYLIMILKLGPLLLINKLPHFCIHHIDAIIQVPEPEYLTVHSDIWRNFSSGKLLTSNIDFHRLPKGPKNMSQDSHLNLFSYLSTSLCSAENIKS